MIFEFGKILSQPLSQLSGAPRQVFFFHNFHVLYRYGTTRRMSPEGVYVPQPLVLRVSREALVDLPLYSRCREWKVGAGYSFCHRDDVGHHSVVLMSEGLSGTAEAADDLVYYEQHAVFLADFFHCGKVILRRHYDTASGDDGFHYDGGYRFWKLPLYGALYLRRTRPSVRLGVRVLRATVEIRGRYVDKPWC